MKEIVVLLMSFILIGCNSSSNDNKEVTTLKENIWINEICYVENRLLSSNSESLSTYYKIAYVFKEKDIIEKRMNYDKDCDNSLSSYYNYLITNLVYYDLGLKENKNNYDIHDIKLEESGAEKDAFYAISHNKLCFSVAIYTIDSQGQVTYNASGISFPINSHGLDVHLDRDNNSIDYKNCLVRK